MRRALTPIVLVTLAIVSGAARGAEAPASPEDLFTQASAAYAEGARLLSTDPSGAAASLRRSAALYEQIISGSPATPGRRSVPLYYDLGNAYLLSGQTGRAVLNFRRAEVLMPLSEAVQANLTVARQKIAPDDATEDGTQRSSLLLLEAVPASIRFAVFAGTFALAWLLAARRLLGGPRRPARGMIAAAAVVSLIAGASLVPRELRLRQTAADAVVIAAEVTARKGPDDVAYEASPEKPIKGGTEVRLIESRGPWALVRLPDASQAWLPATAIERVQAP